MESHALLFFDKLFVFTAKYFKKLKQMPRCINVSVQCPHFSPVSKQVGSALKTSLISLQMC